jgi:uncharacterized protein with HEPN domain
MNDQRKNRLKIHLDKSLEILDKSLFVLNVSFEKCNQIGLKKDFSLDQLESFESLTARFARTSDLFTQKAARTFLRYIGEDIDTFLDLANYLEKFEIVDANKLLIIRALRNEISHEYVEESLYELFREVMNAVPELNKIIENFKNKIKIYI